MVDGDEDEEEEKGDSELANVTRPGVGHDVLAQLGEFERSRNSVTLSPSSSAQVPPVASGSTRQLRRDKRAESLNDIASVEAIITSPTKTPSHTLVPKRPRVGITITRL